MSTEPSSLAKAFFAEAGEGITGAAVGAEQLDMLRGDDGKLPQNVFQLARQSAQDGSRGPGRPPNARNKRNEQLAKLVVQQHGDPVMAMASMYAMPIDQLIELVLIADSTAEREERLLRLIDRAEEMIAELMKSITSGAIFVGEGGGVISADRIDKRIDAVSTMLERVFDAAKALKMKPGDLAIKALNLQLAAARATAEYVHSKKPVEVKADVRTDGVLVMPGAPIGQSFDQKDADIRRASDGIAQMLAKGHIEPAQLAQFRLVDGQLVDAEFEEVDDDEQG